MKMLCILAVLGVMAMANAQPMGGGAGDWQKYWTKYAAERNEIISKSCYAQCFNISDADAQQLAQNERIRQLMNTMDYRALMSIDTLNALMGAGCGLMPRFTTCVNACPAPSSEPERMAKKQITELIDITNRLCAPAVKDHMGCLITSLASNESMAECNRKCNPQLDPVFPAAAKIVNVSQTYEANQNDANLNIVYQTVKTEGPTVTRAGCKWVNCRLNCRKPGIVTRCTPQGWEAAKTVVRIVADMVKDWPAEIRRTPAAAAAFDWPEECKADKLAEERAV